MLALALVLGCTAGRAGAQVVAQVAAGGAAPAATAADEPMQLEVILNRNPTQLIGAFVMRADKRMASRRAELEELGINPPGHDAPDTLIVLDDLPGLAYRYDEATQRIEITAPRELLLTKRYDLSHRVRSDVPVQSGWGAVLNYDLLASSGSSSSWLSFNGASATFDGRVFTPYGTLSQGALLTSTLNDRFEALRLNTTFASSDPETMTT